MNKKTDVEHEQWLDEIITLTEAAALRKVSVETLRSLIRQNKLHVVKLSDKKRGMTRREALSSIREKKA